jgi:putative flippase GtrA
MIGFKKNKNMIKKTLTFFWSHRVQFSKYFTVGVSAVVIDMISLIFLKEFLGIKPVIAVIINQVFIIFYVFLLNKHWSFKEKGETHRQIIRFFVVVVYNYCFSVAAMYIFNHKLNFDYRLVRLGSIILAVSWNFFLYKYWVYAAEKKILPAQENPADNKSALN